MRDHYGAAFAYDLLTGDRHAALPILTTPEAARILDLECGLGTCATALAKTGAAVWATSSQSELARLLGVRCREQNVDRVWPFVGGPEALDVGATFDGVISPYSPQTLDAVAERVGVQGVLWLSFGDSPLGAPTSGKRGRALLHNLKALGFDDPTVYLAHPSSQNVSILLEERNSSAAAYVVSTRAGSTAGRALSTLGPFLPQLAKRLSRGAWLFARRAANTSSCPLSRAKKAVWTPAGGTSPIIWANRGTLTAPLWQRTPAAIFRVDAARRRVTHECEVLEWIEKNVSLPEGYEVPRVLWRERAGERTIAVQTPVSGRCQRLISPHRIPPRVASFLAILGQLHPPQGLGGRSDSALDPYASLDALENALGAHSPAVRVKRIYESVRSTLATVLVHGDFHPANILFRSKGLSVFDWEYAGVGWHGQDWFYFLCTVLCGGSGASDAEMRMANLVTSRRPPYRRLRSRTREFLRSVDIPARFVPHLYALGLVDFARRRFAPEAGFDFERILALCDTGIT